jgi:hypothetical protein
MLQDVDHMEASCIMYVKIGMFDQREQSTICGLTITKFAIVILTVPDDLIFSIYFMYDAGDVLR